MIHTDDATRIAERIREACLEAALAAYEDAGVQGLCEEGRWEVAVGAVRSLDLERILGELAGNPRPPHAAKERSR